MNFTISWISPLILKPHEDIVYDIVRENVEKIRKTGKIIPLIVDSNTLTILDGHHRHFASLILGLKEIPVVFVNYNNEDIVVESWSLRFENGIDEIFLNMLSGNTKGEYCVRVNSKPVYCDDDIFVLYWKIEKIRQKLIKMGYKVVKTSEKIGLILPSIGKQDVVKVSGKGLRFPPKSTRHVYKFFIPREEICLKC